MNFEIAPKSTEIQANWDNAKLYCFSLNINGKTGWRLPTKDELDEIYQSENDFRNTFYWSSTVGNGNGALAQSFRTGKQYDASKDSGGGHVRAIRDLT
jgi:hypothetical protein